MSLLIELKDCISTLGLPVETGVFSAPAPDTYAVLIPLAETFDLAADNQPNIRIEEVRISLFAKGNYNAVKNALTETLLAAGITVTARQYIGFETETGYHHYNIDAADYFEIP